MEAYFDNDLTPRASRHFFATGFEDRTSYLPCRQASVNSRARLPSSASVSFVGLTPSPSLPVLTSTGGVPRSATGLPPLAPLAEKRFPIDGYDKVSRISKSLAAVPC